MSPQASVIVRAKDEAASIERCLSLLRSQTVAVEVIVVDSGSSDGTVDIARRWCDVLVEIPSGQFSYGRALNMGASRATTDVHVALSAHCVPPGADWIERILPLYGRPDAAGAGGQTHLPTGELLRGVFHQDWAFAQRYPGWGFSNHASSWRASVWRDFPFDETLEACEDKEWAWRVMRAGWVIAYEPGLYVDLSHRWREGARRLYQRHRREARALRAFAPMPSFGARELVREWWCAIPEDRHSALAHRMLNYRRAAGLLGTYHGSADSLDERPLS